MFMIISNKLHVKAKVSTERPEEKKPWTVTIAGNSMDSIAPNELSIGNVDLLRVSFGEESREA